MRRPHLAPLLAILLSLPPVAGGCGESTPRGVREVPVEPGTRTGADAAGEVESGTRPTQIPMH